MTVSVNVLGDILIKGLVLEGIDQRLLSILVTLDIQLIMI